MTELIGKGSTLSLNGSVIAQVLDITTANASVETFKTTNLSTGVGHTYAVTGFVEGGEVSFELFYDNALHSTLHGKILAPPTTPDAWVVTLSNGHAQSFSGFLIELPVKIVLADGTKATGKIKVTGSVTP